LHSGHHPLKFFEKGQARAAVQWQKEASAKIGDFELRLFLVYVGMYLSPEHITCFHCGFIYWRQMWQKEASDKILPIYYGRKK